MFKLVAVVITGNNLKLLVNYKLVVQRPFEKYYQDDDGQGKRIELQLLDDSTDEQMPDQKREAC